MSRLIAPVVAMLLAALAASSLVGPGGVGLSAARQASPAAGMPCPTTTEEENEALVRRLFEEGWGQGNLQVLDEVVADDAIVHRPNAASVVVPATTNDTPSPVTLAEAVQLLRADFPDLGVTVEDVIADGDMVAARATLTGTQAEPFEALGAPNTGRQMARAGWMFARVACGKVAEVWVLFDNLTMLRQLGIVSDEELRDADPPTVATPAP